MAAKPENTFIRAIHKLLPASVYHMKTHNPYVAGVPDCYYSGSGGDMWVEYKFVPKLPKTGWVKVNLTALQRQWLKGRRDEGRNVAVIVGSPEGAVVLTGPKLTLDKVEVDWFRARMQNREEVALWLTKQTT